MDNILAYKREILDDRTLNAVFGVVFFVITTALGAYVRIPVPGSPVPITLQTFFVALSGAVLGKRLGFLSQASYLFLGAVGLPIFQGYAFGIPYMFGPTGGYLFGFMLAPFLIGKMLEKDELSLFNIIRSFMTGIMALYSAGVLWLMFIYRISLANAFMIGVLPFFTVEIAKMLSAAMIYQKISRRSKSIFR